MLADYDGLSNLNDVKELWNLCRLCLRKDHLVWAFNDKIKVTENFQNVIYYTTGIEITLTDVISQSVCKRCLEACIKMYQFRMLSQRNDEALQAKLKELQKNKSHIHPSILEVKNTYPTLKLPPLENNILPKVCMELDEVEKYFKDKQLNIGEQLKYAFKILRSMEKIDKDKPNALESCLGQIGKSVVSPLNIKRKHSESSYEIVPKNQEGSKIKLPEDDANGKPHFIKSLGLIPNDKQHLKHNKVRIRSRAKRTYNAKKATDKENKGDSVKIITDKLTDKACNDWLIGTKCNQIKPTLKHNKKRQIPQTKTFPANDKIEEKSREIMNVEPKTKKIKYNRTTEQKSLRTKKNMKQTDDGTKTSVKRRLKAATNKEDCDNNNETAETNNIVKNNDLKVMSKSMEEEDNNAFKSKQTALKSVEEAQEPKELQSANIAGKESKLPVDTRPVTLKTTVTGSSNENYNNNVENKIMEEQCKDVKNNLESITETTPNISYLVLDKKQIDNQPDVQLTVTNCSDVNEENFGRIFQSEEMTILPNQTEVKPQGPNEMPTSPIKLLVGKETKVHVCHECGTYVFHLKNLKRHQLQHRRCRFCGMKFKSMNLAKMHLKQQQCEQYCCLNKLITIPLVKVEKCREIREKYPDVLNSLTTFSDDDAETIIVSSEEEIFDPVVKLIGVKQSELLSKDDINDEFVKKMIEIENESKLCDKSVETEHRPTNGIIWPLQDFTVKFNRLKNVLYTFQIPVNILNGEPNVSLNYNTETPRNPIVLWDEEDEIVDITSSNDIELNSSSSADTLTKSTLVKVNDENSNKANKVLTCENEPKPKEPLTCGAETETVSEVPTKAVTNQLNKNQIFTRFQHVVDPVTGRPRIIQTVSLLKNLDSTTTKSGLASLPVNVLRTYPSKHGALKQNPTSTAQSVMSTLNNFQHVGSSTSHFQQSKLATQTVTSKVCDSQPAVISHSVPLTSVESQVEKLSSHAVNPKHQSLSTSKEFQMRHIVTQPHVLFHHSLNTKSNDYQSVQISNESQIHHIVTQAHVAKFFNHNLTPNANHTLPTSKESQTHQIARMLNQNAMLTTNPSHSQQVLVNSNQRPVSTVEPRVEKQVTIMNPVTTTVTSSQHENATNNSNIIERNPLLATYLTNGEGIVPPLIPIAVDPASGFFRVRNLSELK